MEEIIGIRSTDDGDEDVEHHHHHHKHHHKYEHHKQEEYMTPTETINLFGAGGMGSGVGAGAGAGLGAGLLGGVLGGALLGNRHGLLGNGDGVAGNCVTPTQLQTAVTGIIDAQQNTAVLQGIGDIKAAVPLAEAQVQLALAGSTATINKGVTDAIAASLASQNNINVNVLQTAAANLNATKDSQFATQVAISNSTKEILSALNDQNTANLQRQLAVAESALLETRAESRARGTEVNVTQTVNQNQAQLQAQSQSQQQTILLNQLCHVVNGLQNAVATNSNMIIGNTGAVGTGPQTSAPVNVRT